MNDSFSCLTSVLSGRMTPEFAADQAEAALQDREDEDSEDDK